MWSNRAQSYDDEEETTLHVSDTESGAIAVMPCLPWIVGTGATQEEAIDDWTDELNAEQAAWH